MTAANPALQRTIDGALEGMLEDDSRRVRDAASAALGQTTREPAPAATPPPPNPARGLVLGSDLTPTDTSTCLGGGEACSVVQYALSGRPTIAATSGVITGWAARGQGRVALQVVTLTRTQVGATAQSEFVTLRGNTPQSFHTRLPINKGDFIALLMCPNARLAQSGVGGDVDLRWDKGLLVGQSRARSEMQSEGEEYAFAATIDPHQTATGAGPSPGPCPI